MSNELRYFTALKRITNYMHPDVLRKRSEKLYGMPPAEAIEIAYENMLDEAREAIRGRKAPKGEA